MEKMENSKGYQSADLRTLISSLFIVLLAEKDDAG
jgi:hypothetical protein